MENITINCNNIKISNNSKICLIAGPCQLETEQHAMDMAGKIKEIAIKNKIGFIYKTSFDKANRTSLKGKRGAGLEKSLPVFDRIKKEETPPLGKRVAYLRKRCKDRLAMGHSAPPSNKEDFTKLKVETRLKEISKAAGRDKATAVEEGYIRGEQWARDIIWPKEANA